MMGILETYIKQSKPKEVARHCPNCGKLCWESELIYTSTKRIDCDNGSIVSTLFGICKECANKHKN
jgi:hypothetical protein